MIKKIYLRYKEIIMYLLFGVLTTVLNIVAYWLLYNIVNISNVWSTIIAQLIAIIFAYVTNKLWVFNANSWNVKVIIFEVISFFGCRFASAAFDVLFMWVTVDCLLWMPLMMKIISNVIVVILNYVASKLLIFKK